MTLGPWGIHFDRTNTWWEPARAWMDYLNRCQTLLQEGLFVADLAYFTGDNVVGYTKVHRNKLNPTNNNQALLYHLPKFPQQTQCNIRLFL